MSGGANLAASSLCSGGLSAIFSWYADDFESMGGQAGVLDRYLDEDETRRPAILAAARAGAVRFLEYDWSINQR